MASKMLHNLIHMKSEKLIATTRVIAAFALWSTLGLFFNLVTLPASVFVVFGSLVGLCVLYGYYYLTRQSIPKFTLSLPLVGLFLIAGVKGVIWFRALSLYPIAHAMLIHNLAPVVAAGFSPLFLKERPSVNHLVAIVTGFLGLFLLLRIESDGSSFVMLGALLSFLTAIASGFQDIVQRKLSRTVPGTNQAFVFILGQALGSVLFVPLTAVSTIDWVSFGSIVYFGVVGTALPIVLLSQAFRALKAFEVSILGYTEPVLGALWGALFLRQPIIPATALGGFLIFLSGVTALKEDKQH